MVATFLVLITVVLMIVAVIGWIYTYAFVNDHSGGDIFAWDLLGIPLGCGSLIVTVLFIAALVATVLYFRQPSAVSLRKQAANDLQTYEIKR